jgi:predicted metal-binding membrane protein
VTVRSGGCGATTSIRPERFAIPAIAVVLAWWYLLSGAGMPASMPGMPEMREPASPMALVVMWSVMMTAMMLPGAAPRSRCSS